MIITNNNDVLYFIELLKYLGESLRLPTPK